MRFDDRVTGKLEGFASRARIVHIDIDPAEIHKNKEAHIPMCADVKASLRIINKALTENPVGQARFVDWQEELQRQKDAFPLDVQQRDDVIMPQWAIQASASSVFDPYDEEHPQIMSISVLKTFQSLGICTFEVMYCCICRFCMKRQKERLLLQQAWANIRCGQHSIISCQNQGDGLHQVRSRTLRTCVFVLLLV